jgi:multifunctional methyltransferase subunit TRM112
MKLLTHNLLQCPLSGTYPLKIVPTEVERTESEFRVDVMVNMLPKLEWSVLCEAARDVGYEGLPDEVPADAAENEEFLQVLHSCIIDTHVIEGELVSQTGRRYPINDSIPNMLLQDVRAIPRDRLAPNCPAAHDDYNLDRKSLDRRASTPQLERGYDVTQDIADAAVRALLSLALAPGSASSPCHSCTRFVGRSRWAGHAG